jgi:hypothetical protein
VTSPSGRLPIGNSIAAIRRTLTLTLTHKEN